MPMTRQTAPAVIPPHALAKSLEHIPVTVYTDCDDASKAVAREIAEIIRTKNAAGQPAVLGLATGSSPTDVYQELVRLHREDGLSFKNVVTFNLDEYHPMQPNELQSYHRFMHEHLFDLIDIDPKNVHVPNGAIPADEVRAYCEQYEQKIKDVGGLGFQLLGVGRTGHIGFNEPGSPRDSRTRLITLDKVTRMDAASDFFGEDHVPRKAITMGVDTILSAKRIVLMAFGEGKAQIIRRAVEGPICSTVSASFLQEHTGVRFVIDAAASAKLTRFETPWLIGALSEFDLTWDKALTKRAVIWLSQKLNRAILKLTDEDYNENGLQELLAARGGAYEINIEVFRGLQGTVNGWPAGKTDPAQPADDQRKRVVLFSPHPDDDVISMGGTFIRLCDHGHDVHVAYQTSGNIAVWDEDALRYADFMVEYSKAFDTDSAQIEKIEQQIDTFIKNKQPGQIDRPELQTIKGLIRRTEARSGALYAGVKDDSRIHFLDLPFYETGAVRKKPISNEDVRITVELLQQVKPHQIYSAGDLSDPHGTHRTCLSVVLRAIEQLKNEDWMKSCVLWLYRGAWQEWDIHEIDMAVPLSPGEVQHKRTAIFKHQSQKDHAIFPGPSDSREFWQRAEDRNRETAEKFNQLGLAEYQALESFVRWRG